MRFLESNPMQVALYVMILLDACVVIAEIILDLHAMRSQSVSQSHSLRSAIMCTAARPCATAQIKMTNVQYSLYNVHAFVLNQPRLEKKTH